MCAPDLQAGGCVLGSGALTLSSSNFSQCTAVSVGGALSLAPGSDSAPWPRATVTTSSFVDCSVVGPSAMGGAVAVEGMNISFDGSVFLRGEAAASSSGGDDAATAVCEDTHSSSMSLESGLGGAIYSARSHVALRNTVVESSSATAGGALFATGGSLTLTGVSFRGNNALRGGATVVAGDVSATVTSSVFDGNTATFGGAIMLVDTSSLLLSLCDASNNHATSTGGAFFLGASTTFSASGSTISRNRADLSGGMAFVQSPQVQPSLAAGNSVANNTAKNWGDLIATDSYAVAVAATATARPGDPFSALVTVHDGYGQPVSGLRVSTIAVTSPGDPAALKSSFVNSYDRVRSPVQGLSLHGREGLTYSLVFSVSAPDLLEPVSATVNVTVARCGFFEARGDRGAKLGLFTPFTG